MTAATLNRRSRASKHNFVSEIPSTSEVTSTEGTTITSAPVLIEANENESTNSPKKSPRKSRHVLTARSSDAQIERKGLAPIDLNSTPISTSGSLMRSTKGKRAIITPSTTSPDFLNEENTDDESHKQATVRRTLIMPPVRSDSDSSESLKSTTLPPLVELSSFSDDDEYEQKLLVEKKTLPFSKTKVNSNVRNVYKIINRMTGRLGGNGSGGAIYGELTVTSMQKMINLMKEHMGFDKNSRFIDVGCGLGKPNLHVAQDPGVQFSYGIEMERVRWLLGMHNLNHVLKDAKKKESGIGHHCIFAHGNINQANTFDPFTHVYMFDIGFPPTLFHQLSKMFNKSKCNYLVCYHGPRLMIDRYNFDVELIVQMSTSMHGSSENHMGYLYKRSKMKKAPKSIPCDSLFSEAWKLASGDMHTLSEYVEEQVYKEMDSSISRRTRSSTRRLLDEKQ